MNILLYPLAALAALVASWWVIDHPVGASSPTSVQSAEVELLPQVVVLCLGCTVPAREGSPWCSQMCRNRDDRHDEWDRDE
ncbi:hypothetical protein [Streptomyces sp. NPDC005953]|uniref:hypothetical protein n=1 Tax=Streptomyces sp. NPDC005953 TaxID=3156719 RepID=UPI0033D811A8